MKPAWVVLTTLLVVTAVIALAYLGLKSWSDSQRTQNELFQQKIRDQEGGEVIFD